MLSHEPDLRAEVHDDERVRQIQNDYHSAGLEPRSVALLDFAVKLTLRPREMRESDIAGLRAAGFDDATIVDAVQTVGYFNYANRVMDALGVELEPEMRRPTQ